MSGWSLAEVAEVAGYSTRCWVRAMVRPCNERGPEGPGGGVWALPYWLLAAWLQQHGHVKEDAVAESA